MVLVTLADSRHFLGSSSTTRQGTTPSSSPCFLFSLSPPLPLPLSSSSSPPLYPPFSLSAHPSLLFFCLISLLCPVTCPAPLYTRTHTHTHTHTHSLTHTEQD